MRQVTAMAKRIVQLNDELSAAKAELKKWIA